MNLSIHEQNLEYQNLEYHLYLQAAAKDGQLAATARKELTVLTHAKYVQVSV